MCQSIPLLCYGKIMKKGDILQGYVERCDFPNKGRVVIKAEDGTQDVVTVKNALPGQTVSCVINKSIESVLNKYVCKSSKYYH